MIFIIILLIAIAILLYLYWWVRQEIDYWKSIDIPYNHPISSLFDFIKGLLRIESFADQMKDLYQRSNSKCFGTYSVIVRTITVCDPELIKKITIKDFDYFQDHVDSFFKRDVDSVFSKSLFALRGNQWRKMRATLSPAFTGRKMRGIFISILECGKQFSDYYKKKCTNQHPDGAPLELELKDVFTRFTNDVIATTAFGVKVNSFENPNNTFYKMGQEITNWIIVKVFLIMLCPSIMKFLKITFVPSHVESFFNDIIEETIVTREKENIFRPDMIQLLMEARQGNDIKEKHADDAIMGFATVKEYLDHNDKEKLNLTNKDIAAQAFLFFLGGFETVSTGMCFITMELAINVDIQRRLQDEIDEVMGKCNENLTYDDLHLMKYLDMVVSEGLRKWPPFPMLDRQCVKPYTLKYDGKQIEIGKGQWLGIPTYAIHWDPTYYPNPFKFDPERFNDTNKENINIMTYLPFGTGPRNCLGSRMALMELKIALIYLFRNFNVDVTQKTKIPIVLGNKSFNLSVDDGFWVGLTPRLKK